MVVETWGKKEDWEEEGGEENYLFSREPVFDSRHCTSFKITLFVSYRLAKMDKRLRVKFISNLFYW
jgi:hypothetical protein